MDEMQKNGWLHDDVPAQLIKQLKYRCIPFSLAMFIVVLALSAGSAWSFDAAQYERSPSLTKVSSSPTHIPDTCLPLLQTIRQTPSISGDVRNQHSAGKAAVFAMIIGVQYATMPPGKASAKHMQPHNARAGSGDPNSRSALSVLAYRQCLKEQALLSTEAL